MELSFIVSTRVILGRGCILKNEEKVCSAGKRAFIVTSASSAKNGSLTDVKKVLESNNIPYNIYDKTPPNPSLSDVDFIGTIARESNCDFIIGIGGGSALDAAKAVAVLAANDIKPEELYPGNWKYNPLPIIAIPTTCGTGSEVTPVSVLTRGDSKQSFSSELITPKIAFLDAGYIENLPQKITVETAVDALSHAVEGYLMVDSWVSDMLAERVFKFFELCKLSLQRGEYSAEIRERLLFMAMIAGLNINITRTSAVHAMGYALTTQRGLSHGLACGVLLGEYINFCYDTKKEKINTLFSFLKVKNVEEFKKLLTDLLQYNESYNEGELEKYTEMIFQSAIVRANPRKMVKEDVLSIYKKSLLV